MSDISLDKNPLRRNHATYRNRMLILASSVGSVPLSDGLSDSCSSKRAFTNLPYSVGMVPLGGRGEGGQKEGRGEGDRDQSPMQGGQSTAIAGTVFLPARGGEG